MTSYILRDRRATYASCRVFVSLDEEDMSLKGNLIDMSLVDIIQVFDGAKKSGVLLLQSNPLRGVIFCRGGG